MEENLRPVTSPANPDLAYTEDCINEFTRPSSNSSCMMENLKETSGHNANDERGAWTDEKHKKYLNRLEASFVDQLNHSMGMLMWHSEQKRRDQQNSSKKLPVNTDQFPVLRDRCRHKINFVKKQPLLKTISNSHSILESQWTRHFRCEGKILTTKSDDLQEKTEVPKDEISRGKRTFPQDLGGSLAEVSDQNFVDGDQNEKPSNFQKVKRLKKADEDFSSHDQVVPLGKFQVTELSTLGIASPEREEQLCEKWSLENADRFVLQ